MRRSPLPPLLVAASIALPLACAAAPLTPGTARAVVVGQALETLGAAPVGCDQVGADLAQPPDELTCARVPGSMFGFFREAVHGRWYEYLDRGTMLLLHPWRSGAGDELQAEYVIDGGVLRVERVRAHGRVYAVFRFHPVRSTNAAPGSAASGR